MHWFWAWAVAGGLVAMSILAIVSFGILLFPIAVLVVAVVASRARFWPDVLGSLEGVGAAVLWPAWINWGLPRCVPGVMISSPLMTEGGWTYACSGIDYQLLAISGLTVMVAGLVGYRFAGEQRRESTTTSRRLLIREDEGTGKCRIFVSGALVGPLAATETLVILAVVSLGFYASLGGLLIAGTLAFMSGTGASALVDPRVSRNAGIVAGFIAALFVVYVVILPSLEGPVPPGVSHGGPGVPLPR
jgi:hypothetical protein